MKLIKAAIDHPQHFDRIFFLSGMDYPLWSKERISEWAAQLGEREILSGINMNTPLIQGQQRLLYTPPPLPPSCHRQQVESAAQHRLPTRLQAPRHTTTALTSNQRTAMGPLQGLCLVVHQPRTCRTCLPKLHHHTSHQPLLLQLLRTG